MIVRLVCSGVRRPLQQIVVIYMAYVLRRLPGEVANRITLLATSSPSARCFDTTGAEDEWTRLVLEAFKEGRIFHADRMKARLLQSKRDQMLEDIFYSRE